MSGAKGRRRGEGPSTGPKSPATPMMPAPHAVHFGYFMSCDYRGSSNSPQLWSSKKFPPSGDVRGSVGSLAASTWPLCSPPGRRSVGVDWGGLLCRSGVSGGGAGRDLSAELAVSLPRGEAARAGELCDGEGSGPGCRRGPGGGRGASGLLQRVQASGARGAGGRRPGAADYVPLPQLGVRARRAAPPGPVLRADRELRRLRDLPHPRPGGGVLPPRPRRPGRRGVAPRRGRRKASPGK